MSELGTRMAVLGTLLRRIFWPLEKDFCPVCSDMLSNDERQRGLCRRCENRMGAL